MPTVTDLAARITLLEPSCGPVRLVAIDGPGGSGKTTFAGLLSEALGGAPVVHSDDFPIPWDQGPESWFVHLTRDVLEPLQKGSQASFLRYDWRRGTYAERLEVPPVPVVIVEGVSVGRRSCPAAIRVWVEVPREIRRARVAARDGVEHTDDWIAWTAAEDAWFAREPVEADAFVDGTTFGVTWARGS
ncbi:uridine kinase family protein [Herbidospora sp. RD11066]